MPVPVPEEVLFPSFTVSKQMGVLFKMAPESLRSYF